MDWIVKFSFLASARTKFRDRQGTEWQLALTGVGAITICDEPQRLPPAVFGGKRNPDSIQAMQHLIATAEQHALWIVFFNVLLAQCGVPLPVFPTLMTAAAIAGQSPYQIAEIVVVGAAGALLGDLMPYWYGRRYGRHVLGLLCRVSLSPDFCVRRTEIVLARIGPSSLLFAKFIPGMSLISVAMAGIGKMPMPVFLLLDGAGKLLYVSVAVAVGRIFQNAIASVVATLAQLGEFGVVAVIAAIGLYMLAKWFRRQLFIRQLRMDRITVAELRRLMDDGQEVVILDVRPKEIRAQDGIIPGAVAAHPADIDPVIRNYSRDAEIVVYCACPNEEFGRHRRQASQARRVQENTAAARRHRGLGWGWTCARTRPVRGGDGRAAGRCPRTSRLAHVPQKLALGLDPWVATGFAKRTCSNNWLARGSNWTYACGAKRPCEPQTRCAN